MVEEDPVVEEDPKKFRMGRPAHLTKVFSLVAYIKNIFIKVRTEIAIIPQDVMVPEPTENPIPEKQ